MDLSDHRQDRAEDQEAGLDDGRQCFGPRPDDPHRSDSPLP
jgi:hypothetical protein